MKKRQKKLFSSFLSFLLVISMILPYFPAGHAAAAAPEMPEMEITEEELNANDYETYYYADGIRYLYDGEEVEFTSDTEFTAGGETYALKNKKTEVSVETSEDGNVSVRLSGLTTPVGSIPSLWNSASGGAVQVVYKTDISGMEEVRSAKLANPIVLEGLEDGVYHLTDGTIYEKANQWSQGYDFGDGKGTVTEGYFGTLPDIVLTVGEGTEEPSEPEEPLSANLKALTFDVGTLDKEFSPEGMYYTLTVPNGTKTVVPQPTPENSKTNINVRASGEYYDLGAEVPVEDGAQIRLTCSLDGVSAAKTYYINIAEEGAEPRKPDFKDVRVSGGTLTPEFNGGTYYDLYIEEGTESFTIDLETVNSKTTVSIGIDGTGLKYASGEAIPVKDIDGKTLRLSGSLNFGNGSSSSRSYFVKAHVLEAAEDGYGFTFSDADGELKIKEDGQHSDGTTYLRIPVSKGTAEVTMFRERQTELTNQSGDVIVSGGLGDVKLATASYMGKDNYFKVVAGKHTYYVYFDEIEKIEIDENLPSVEITEDDLNGNAYDTYYYSEDYNYYYNGEYVVFTDNEHFTADEQTYELKNQKTAVSVENENDGNVKISLTNLKTPVGSIPSQWNSASGGAVQVVYKTDIPGMEEVKSANLKDAIALSEVPDGTWHLTGGMIYEKANSYSPGYDFGDGKGKVKENFFGTLPDVTFTVKRPVEVEEGYIGTAVYAEVYDDFTNDLWLQYQQKEMKVGDKADLYPWRMEQIITDTINNDVFRPNFNFEIISGSSVTLDKTSSDQKAVVTAVKPGTSIVKVTYDAADYKGKHWDAVSDVNIGYAVFTVGENGKAVIKTNEALKNWRHYDTIYYTEGKTVPYEFTVDTENAKSVKVKVNGMLIEGNGNKYTAELENRSNIIGIEAFDEDGNVTSMYRIIDARFIEINVANKTNPEADLKAGDTATVSFRGITMPIYKLATIYNPQFGGGTWVTYENEKFDEEFKGKCSQWDLATRNSFDVTFTEAGTYDFHSAKGIRCAWWGDDLGSDLVKQGQGSPNTNANSLEDFFSVLPDFTITVGEGEAAPAVDKTQLSDTIKKAEALKEADYTAESYKSVKEALAEAKAVEAKADAAQDEVNAAEEKLANAVKALEKAPEKPVVDKTKLSDTIKKAEALKEADYTAESYKSVKEALAEAKKVEAKADAAQEEVNAAEEKLANAVKALEKAPEKPVVDKTKLSDTIKKAEALKEADYTEESYKAVKEALAEAKKVEAKADAAQEEVNAAEEKLAAAVKALEKVPEEPEKPAAGGTVTFTIERFTIGQGFYQKPVQLKFKAGQTAMDVLADFLGDKGVYNADKTYLVGIKGADLGLNGVTVPVYIKELLGGPDTQEAVEFGNGNDDVLKEFDYSQGSGWMYSINGKMPDVGMAAYELKDGDVFRLQFTLMWGMDISKESFSGETGVPVSEKEDAMKLLAEFTGMENFEELMKDQAINKAFHDLYKKVQNTIESQESIDAAVKALQDALAGEPEKPAVDKTKLSETIKKAEALKEADYTEESYKAVKEALTEAKAVEAKADAAQDEVNAAEEKLANAVKALEKAPEEPEKPAVDKTKLSETIKKAEALKEADYTEESYKSVKEALTEAKAVEAKADAAQDEVNAAEEKLANAVKALEKAPEEPEKPAVDKTKLSETIKKAEALKEADYTEESYKSVKEALTEAKAVEAKADAAQDEVNAAEEKLANAVKALEKAPEEPEKPAVDKTKLSETIKKAEALKEADYTEESYKSVKEALTEAKAVEAKADAAQDEVNAAEEKLANAVKALEKAPEEPEKPAVDKTKLSETIKKAEALKEADYTEESYKSVKEALTEAKAVEAKADAAQDEVNAAEEKLANAVKALEKAPEEPEKPAVDKTKLSETIKKAEALKEADYTEESYKSVKEALTEAKAVEAKADAAQDEVNAAEEKLANAVKALKKVPSEPQQPEKPLPGTEDKKVTLTYKNYPVSVTGKGIEGYELKLEALKATDESVKLMQKSTPSDCSLIRLYDVKLLKDGKEVQPENALEVNFNVGTKYNGKTLTVLHVVDGKIEKLKGTVEDGILTVSADSFGSFGVMVAASSSSSGNSNVTDDDTNTTVKGNSATGNAASGNGSVKTGDETQIMLYVSLLLVSLFAGVTVLYRKRKYNEK